MLFNGIFYHVIVLTIALGLLVKFSHQTMLNAERIADITGYGKTTVGFVLISLSTTLPEMTVAVFSTANEEAVGIAVGNVLGSNIVNTCLVFGTCILYASWKKMPSLDAIPFVTREDVKSLQFGLFSASLIPLSLLYLGSASRFIGVILVSTFIWNTYELMKKRDGLMDEGTLGGEKKKLGRYTVMLIIGVAGVIINSYFIVDSATIIAITLGVPKIVIGATIVALGTSLPELAISLESTKTGNINMALANIIGSGFINTTLILGLTLVVANLKINIAAFANVAIFSLIANLFLWYFISGDRIKWKEGAILVFLYALFIFSTLRF